MLKIKNTYFIFLFLFSVFNSDLISQNEIAFTGYEELFQNHPEKKRSDSLTAYLRASLEATLNKLNKKYSDFISGPVGHAYPKGKREQELFNKEFEETQMKLQDSIAKYHTFARTRYNHFVDSTFSKIRNDILSEMAVYAKENNFRLILNSDKNYSLFSSGEYDCTAALMEKLRKKYSKK